MSEKIAIKRLKYEYQGRTIYEWEQTLEEVQAYIQTPPGVRAKMLDVSITPSQLTVGLKGNPPFINVRRAAPAVCRVPTLPLRCACSARARARARRLTRATGVLRLAGAI